MPDAVGPGGLAGMDRDAQTGIPYLAKMRLEQGTGEAQLVTGQIRNNFV